MGILTTITVIVLSANQLVSLGKPYMLNVAPTAVGNYADNTGPQPFIAPGQYYSGELTDGAVRT